MGIGILCIIMSTTSVAFFGTCFMGKEKGDELFE